MTELAHDLDGEMLGAPADPAPLAAHAPALKKRPAPRPGGGKRWLILAVAVCVVGGVVAWGIIDRHETITTLDVQSQDASVPKVTLVSPTKGPPSRVLQLPGDVKAWYTAPIYAQVTGYVQSWEKDYGAIVKKGDLLATIATPDLDKQLAQARADHAIAQAKYDLAQVTARRWESLAGTQAVSQQSVDVKVAEAKEAASEVKAAEYNVSRLKSQEAFKYIVAPFDGVVTARLTDIGSFVTAAGGSAGQEGHIQELFTVSDIHQMRLFVSVPQDYAASIKPDLTATMTLPQFPNQTFKAQFKTTAKAFNQTARTVLTEFTVPNPEQDIWPGSYAEVRFEIPANPNVIVVPEQALLFRSQGMQVAVVRGDGKIHMQDITLGLNLGQTVQVTRGLTLADHVVANPSEGLLEGEPVQVVNAPPQNTDDRPPPPAPPSQPAQPSQQGQPSGQKSAS